MKLIALSVVNSEPRSIRATVNDGSNIVPVLLTDDHPSFNKIDSLVQEYTAGDYSGDDLAQALVDGLNVAKTVEDKFVRVGGILDGRMAIKDARVTIDYEPVDPVLEAHILRMLKDDGTPNDTRNWASFSRFIENLYSNTSEFVRKQLFSWMTYENFKGHGLTLTDDGCFIGYKGLQGTVEAAESIRTGTAISDGVVYNGHIPNKLGSIVEMPRDKVEADPYIGCAPGLHVGTYDYASGWARGVLVTVKVNPRDVVSVPVHCAAQKIRVCRYEVIESVEVAYTAPSFTSNSVRTPSTTSVAWGEDMENFPDVLKNVIGEKSFLIDYTDIYGNSSVREVTPHEVSEEHLKGISEDTGKFRTFRIDGIASAERIATEEEVAAAESATSHAGMLRNAAANGKDLFIVYVDAKGNRTSRVITPDTVDENAGTFRVYCHKSNGFRTFLLSRVEKMGVCDGVDTDEDIAKLDLIRDAVRNSSTLRFKYTSKKGVTKNYEVIPNNLSGDWMYADKAGKPRIFVISRIEDLTSAEVESGNIDPEVEEEIARYGYTDSPDPLA